MRPCKAGMSEKDIKKLWGLAAGRCSFPGCGVDCIQLAPGDPTLIGEMAHIIAQKPLGPRGQPRSGLNDYTNRILFCPTHHTLVDKRVPTYSVRTILKWKTDHEASVRNKLSTPSFASKKELCEAILRQLVTNYEVWKTYGPESATALSDPTSNVANLWTLRKLSIIIPANARIVGFIRHNAQLFTSEEYTLCANFIEHAAGFEASAFNRLDCVPLFPHAFEEMISRAAKE